MTRLGHGGLTLNREWMGVDELVGTAVTRINQFVPNANVRTHIAPNLKPLWAHPALLEQALFNIIENACKFSPSGESVSVDVHSPDGMALEIDVTDRGPGIPEADRARIFDMFYSVERGDRGTHGTGLGLTIAQGMIGAHGGAVTAHAGEDGRGTRIRITLPGTTLLPPSDT